MKKISFVLIFALAFSFAHIRHLQRSCIRTHFITYLLKIFLTC